MYQNQPLTLTGTLKTILPLEQGVGKASGKEWKKQAFVITILKGSYNQDVAFQLFNDRVAQLQGLQPGQNITVVFDPQSREYQGRWYTDLNALSVQQLQQQAVAPQQGYRQVPQQMAPQPQQGYQQSSPLPF